MGKTAQQTTITRPMDYHGIGLHSGENCAVSLLPAEPDTGIVFIKGGVEIPGLVEFVADTRRGTTIGRNGVQIGCIEHLLASFYGLGIDNVRVVVEGSELPAGDGSALAWVKLLRRAGKSKQSALRQMRRLEQGVWVGGDGAWAMAGPAGSGLTLAVGVEFEHTIAGRQTLWLKITPGRFARELAPARTFAMADEIEALRAAGLSKGGSLENAFVVGREAYSGPLRFQDEVVRHKTLDLLGDLALCGGRFEGQVVAVKPSHKLNTALAKELKRFFNKAVLEGLGP